MNTKEISERNDKVISDFTRQFASNLKPIEVSFRTLLPEIRNIDRYTHLIHTYPAKLLVHIPYFFLNNTTFSKKGDSVLDPFSGSGTVLLESLVAGRNAIGADANPLARLIAEVKTTQIETKKLSQIAKRLVTSAKNSSSFTIPDVVNCDYWFPHTTCEQLARLVAAISRLRNDQVKKFMLVSFSNCVKKVSYADQRISVPVRLNPTRYKDKDVAKKVKSRLLYLESVDVYEKFLSITEENIKRIKELESLPKYSVAAKVISKDARHLSSKIDSSIKIADEKVQLVITSPPYAGAQKYIRASSLNLGWTKLAKIAELNELDKNNIGRENYRKSEIELKITGIKKADQLIKRVYKIKPIRATIIANYLIEMKDSLDEMFRVLKKNGYLVLIIGNNKVCDLEFNTQEYFTSYLLSKGLQLQFKLIDDIKSYGLMTKRNKTADIISREWILVFKK